MFIEESELAACVVDYMLCRNWMIAMLDELTIRLAASTRLVTLSSRESRCPHDTPTVDQCVFTCWLRKVKGTICGRADDLNVSSISTDISIFLRRPARQAKPQ